jgi:hypothetical protein
MGSQNRRANTRLASQPRVQADVAHSRGTSQFGPGTAISALESRTICYTKADICFFSERGVDAMTTASAPHGGFRVTSTVELSGLRRKLCRENTEPFPQAGMRGQSEARLDQEDLLAKATVR